MGKRPPTRVFNLRLRVDWLQRLEEDAERHGMSTSAYVRLLLAHGRRVMVPGISEHDDAWIAAKKTR